MNETVQIHEAELARLLNENRRLRAVVKRVATEWGHAVVNREVVVTYGLSGALNGLAAEVAKVPVVALPVVALSAEQASLAIDALDVWLMNMQCVEETEAMIAVRQFLRDALEGMGESDG